MATAFSPQERAEITKSLMDEATGCAATIGMKKTSVEQLASAAGISKSAFYSFYECKELLFLDVLEELHTQMYGSAARVLEENKTLGKRERVALALKQALCELESRNMIQFIQRDLPALLRKLPPDVLKAHYHSDMEHIKRLLEISGTVLTCALETALTAMIMLLMSLSIKPMFGSNAYDEAIGLLIEGACARMIDG